MWIMAIGMALVSCFYIMGGVISAKDYGMQSGWGYRLESLNDSGRSISDYEPVWQGNAYVLKGKNPFDVMNQEVDFDPQIGPIIKGTTNVPWTYGLGNVLIPGFLPYKGAMVVSFLWWLLFYAIAVFLLCKKMDDKGIKDSLFKCLLVLALFCQCSLGAGLESMNPAFLVVPLLFVVSLLDDKRYPWLVGCCLALAMIKPQAGALFFIPFIVKGNFKAVLTGGGLVLLSLLAVSLSVGANPVSLVQQAFSDGFSNFAAAKGETWQLVAASQGIFSALFSHSDFDSATLLHWIVFIPYTFLLCWRFRKSPFYILFSIPFVVSMLWMYNLPVNRHLGLLLIALMLMLYTQPVPNNRQTFLAYALMALMLLPLMSGAVARALNNFIVWPITALLVFVALHIVLYWYAKAEKRGEMALDK